MSDPNEVAVSAFRQSEQQLQDLLGGKVDLTMLQEGQQHFLRDVQEMLRQSESRFRNMFVASVTGMAISTPQGRFLEANPAYCRLLGYEKEQLLALRFADLTHPDDLAVNLALRDEILSGQRDSFVLEKRYRRKDGAFVWVNSSVSATRTMTGEVATLVALAEDITERKAAEMRLTRLNRLHTVLSEVSEAILRIRDRQQLYPTICRIIVERGLLRRVSITEFEGGQRVAVTRAVFGDLEGVVKSSGVIPLGAAPSNEDVLGKAIRTGVYAICNDISIGGAAQSSAETNLKPGIRASAAFPFRIDHNTIGFLVISAGETDYFQDDEITLMHTLAESLTFAIGEFEKDDLRQRAEAKSHHLAAIVESSADAIISEDLDGMITSWNSGAASLFGYTGGEMLGESIFRLIPASRYDEATHIAERTKRGESVQNIETLRQAKDGGLINVSITSSPIRDASNGVIGLSEVAHDITQTKKSEGRFRRLVDSNAQGVFFWNVNGQISDANDAFLALVGYTRGDLESGKLDWVKLTPPEYAELNQRALKELAESGVCRAFEKEYIRKDGLRVPVLIGAAVFDDSPDDGAAFVLDLTERKKLEKQFRQAQKMEAIGNLAGGVAHDFNNVLAIIQLQAHCLKMSKSVSAKQSELIDNIILAVERAAGLTRQLLLFGSREALRPTYINLTESISRTIEMLKRLVGEQIDMQLKMTVQPIFLHADAAMMDQVLLNLVVNARDAMPNGGTLVIETSAVELDEFAASHSAQARPGSFVCLRVSDSGCGIPPEHLSRIFEPFFTTKDIGKGTGLGLSTVFGIVQQHHGWINVYSEVGHGTTFRVYFPKINEEVKSDSPELDRNAACGGNETILLVEDDPGLRGSIRAVLSELGYRVVEARDGSAAVDHSKDHDDHIHLLLTDLVMPGGMSGRQLAQALIRERPRLKVAYMSGYSVEVADKKFPISEGVNFLSKPFPAAALAEMVRTCLDSS